MPKLLTRDDFRELCLKRDNYRCVVCGKPDGLSEIDDFVPAAMSRKVIWRRPECRFYEEIPRRISHEHPQISPDLPHRRIEASAR
jgi:5-methylcytosine-specific restriction endonuclease McrA